MYDVDLAWIHHHGFSECGGKATALLPGNAKVVVEIGCGSGVLAGELSEQGRTVIAFDASHAMIDLARTTAPNAHFEVARFAEAKIPDCDAIISTGEVLNYGTFDEVRTFIANAANALQTGGTLVFDIAERGSYPAHDEVRAGGDDWSVIAIKESNGTHLRRRVLTFRNIDGQVRRSEEVHELELYDREAMLELLRPHFRVRLRRSYGSYRLPKGHVVYVCVKR